MFYLFFFSFCINGLFIFFYCLNFFSYFMKEIWSKQQLKCFLLLFSLNRTLAIFNHVFNLTYATAQLLPTLWRFKQFIYYYFFVILFFHFVEKLRFISVIYIFKHEVIILLFFSLIFSLNYLNYLFCFCSFHVTFLFGQLIFCIQLQ